MKVAIAGGHGQIALRLTRLLHGHGDIVTSLIRKAEESTAIKEAGGDPIVCDLETAEGIEIAEAINGMDAVVFAAGAGPGSGPERKDTVDLGGAVKLIEACKAREIDRYVMISSTGADPDAQGDDTFAVYLRAKGKADAQLEAGGLEHTIVRPGRLTDDPGTGKVAIVGANELAGEISRDDVAGSIAACLSLPNTIGKTIGLQSGDIPIHEAIGSV